MSFDCVTWVQGDILMGAARGQRPSAQVSFHELGHNQFL